VAQLGGQLFSRHLVAIEVAGTLLLVALVGAVAIVSHGRPAAVGEGSDRG
jgi:NADH:ubiquinone oxidoreductase subunit 6 (subunit J)